MLMLPPQMVQQPQSDLYTTARYVQSVFQKNDRVANHAVPQFPDRSADYTAWLNKKAACEAQLGHLDGLDCVLPTPQPVTPQTYATAPQNGSNDHTAWLISAGIPQSDWWAVDWIVSRESGWDPCSYYPGQHNCNGDPISLGVACGLVQQNPCGKIPGDWRDPVAALVWQKNYVLKYGGYAGAVAFWRIHNAY